MTPFFRTKLHSGQASKCFNNVNRARTCTKRGGKWGACKKRMIQGNDGESPSLSVYSAYMDMLYVSCSNVLPLVHVTYLFMILYLGTIRKNCMEETNWPVYMFATTPGDLRLIPAIAWIVYFTSLEQCVSNSTSVGLIFYIWLFIWLNTLQLYTDRERTENNQTNINSYYAFRT